MNNAAETVLDRDTIEGRLETQRRNTAVDSWMALKSALKMLDEVTGQLDSVVMPREEALR